MNLPVQHLSDEAVAAFADGALGNGARNRAARHVAECAECAHAVAVQREAVWALRAAPAPSLPIGLLDRLRDVPSTTPLDHPPVDFDDRGGPLFPAFGTAALVEPRREPPVSTTSHERRHRPYGLLAAAAAVVAVGAVSGAVVSTSGSASSRTPTVRGPVSPATARPTPAASLDLLRQPVAGTRGFARTAR